MAAEVLRSPMPRCVSRLRSSGAAATRWGGRCLPITQAAQGQPPPSGGQRWLRQAAATGRW